MVAIGRLGALLGLIVLGSCSQNLNMSQIEADIKDDIERQGRRLTLQAVICPNSVPKQAERYFRCVGELPDGSQFTINVTQQDDQGAILWDVPSSKVLINLASLEDAIQRDIKEAVGKSFAIDCRDTYRVNKRGETFECDVIGTGTIAAGRLESVLVKVNSESNLEWQEIVIGNATSATEAGTTGAAAGSASRTTPKDAGTSSSAKPESPAAPADGSKKDDNKKTDGIAATTTKPSTESVAEDDDAGDRQ